VRIGFLGLIGAFPPRNQHLRTTAEHIRRGILEAGSHPLEFPGLSLGEAQIRRRPCRTAISPWCGTATASPSTYQADKGVKFDLLVGNGGAPVARDNQ
jgi:hypothetical protein